MIEVSHATNSDLKYIDSLQKKNAEELSFYPTQVFEREIESKKILLAKINNEPAGYLYHGAFAPLLKIHQACIQYDVRGQLYGSELIRFLIEICEYQNCLSIKLRCGSDISANFFWQAMGFYCEAVTPGGIRRMREINNWRYDLQPVWFAEKVFPSNKKQDSSIWRKRDKSQKISQFSRGKRISDYRKNIVRDDENAP
tara:strand:- start:35 stop:628 length:594 start_codon:yes stop_codon:yes gene_type:complete